MQLFQTLHTSASRFWKVAAGFWLAVAVVIYLESYLTAWITGVAVQPIDMIQYAIRWSLWALGTPLIVWLAVRFPITREQAGKGILLQIIFSVLFLLLVFGIEIPIVDYIASHRFRVVASLKQYLEPYVLKFHSYIFLYFIIVGVINVLLYIRKYREKQGEALLLEHQLVYAQLQTLKMQLQPHFLFNTHHAIISLMSQGETGKAIDMLTRLSDLLRATLDLKDEQYVSLQAELELTRNYLDIIQVRFNDRLQVQWAIDPQLLHEPVPFFILQPLVENAVQHGISASAAAGWIIISAERHQDKIQLTVSDDGKGLPAGLDPRQTKGVGLKNVRERLLQLYGATATFVIRNQPGGGTEAIIELPYES